MEQIYSKPLSFTITVLDYQARRKQLGQSCLGRTSWVHQYQQKESLARVPQTPSFPCTRSQNEKSNSLPCSNRWDWEVHSLQQSTSTCLSWWLAPILSLSKLTSLSFLSWLFVLVMNLHMVFPDYQQMMIVESKIQALLYCPYSLHSFHSSHACLPGCSTLGHKINGP